MTDHLPVNRNIRRALNILDDHQERVGHIYERRREHRRQPVKKQLKVMTGDRSNTGIIDAWTYDVSRSGIGFICECPMQPGPIRICLGEEEGLSIWMHALLRHCKEVTDGIFACGAQFQGRIGSASSSAPASAASS